MNIKVGDYVESLHGMVGVVKAILSTEHAGDNEQFAFDWEVTRPSVRVGYSGCFSGNESELWQHYRQIGLYRNPFRKEKTTKQKIEPIEFGKIEKARATKVTISTNRDVKTERGEFDTLKLTKLTVTDLAVKINEIINYLNTEGC